MDQSCNVIQNYLKDHKKRETRIQWLLEEDEQKELYDDLGIIGEISSPEPGKKNLSYAAEHIKKASKCCDGLQNCKHLKFETPSSGDHSMDVKLQRAINRKQRKRSRQSSKFIGCLSHAKIGKMDLNDLSHPRSTSVRSCTDLSMIGQLPDEVLLKIYRFCNTETRVFCSRVCWRWYHIANDESLWQQVSLSKHVTNMYQLQRMLKRGVRVLCLNCATVSEKAHQSTSHNSSATNLEETSFSTMSPRLDPFSRGYHYSVHSLDFTNAIVSHNTLCLILTRCNRLRNLSLEGLTLSHNVLRLLMRGKDCKLMRPLYEINGKVIKTVFRSIASCTLLERLNLCLCHDMTLTGLQELLVSCNKILELNLGWTNLCRSDPTQIVQNLPNELAQINMSGFRDTLRDAHMIEMLKKCPALVEVDVSDSNLLTGYVIDEMIQCLSKSLRAVNLSRCYSISPNCFLRFSRLPQLRYLDVFGVMDDASIGMLASALPRVRVCLRPFSAIARPSPSALYGTRRRTIWGYLVV